MKKALIALSVALVALLALGSQARADDATMHNCPQEGKWAISVWTGDETDAGEALGTCGNIEVAYALTPTGAWERYIVGAPEVNTLDTIDKYQGVFALGGPAAPVVPEPTNVSIYGTLPDGCTPELLTVAARSAGDGGRSAFVGRLHDKPFTTIEQTDKGQLLTETFQQMPVIKEFTLLCNEEFLVYADVPEAKGDAHIYTISVLVTGNAYEVFPRTHEYMMFEWGDGRIGRLGYGGKVAPNPTCPNDAWMWDERDPRGFWCEGYPDAVFGAHACGPDQEPEPGKDYCVG